MISVWSEKHILMLMLAFRLVNAFIVRTWFVPDEFYQSLEPAHRMVFNSGYLTWEWDVGLRSFLFPLFFAIPWAILKVLHLDFRNLIILTPCLQMSFCTALGDISLFKLAQRLFGTKTAYWTILSYYSMWFPAYCAPRTLANTAETILMLIGLDHYAWPKEMLDNPRKVVKSGRNWLYICCACLATIIRPTSALIWAPLCCWHLYRVPMKCQYLFRQCFTIGLPILLLSCLIDRMCYGRWVVSFWNFLEFNVLQGGSQHFGSHPLHWYLTAGIPSVFTVHLIPISIGVWKLGGKSNPVFLLLSLFYLLVHSALTHKEQRFLLPLIPILSMYSGQYFASMSLGNVRKEKKRNSEKQYDAKVDELWARSSYNVKGALAGLSVVNLIVFLYCSLVHQSGPIAVTKALHKEAQLRPARIQVEFLMPCCSTPFYSHVHAPIPMKFLTCTPNLNDTVEYVDEADVFYQDPKLWVQTKLSIKTTHIVLYDSLWNVLKMNLEDKGFSEFKSFFHAHFTQGSRQSQHILIVRRTVV